ncbi:hypothetical protein J5N97_025227 [Dioscorea zingiberensis]|uniref:Myb-like domain-containing protein n=1 Tax=Dioscorea zingiberensis TaxID=325984 RepID=A0A9D5H9P6_9LILI|nr:hypothetical protein J5N97_025227 [Dioscorea zingiberensis]
MQPAAAAYGGVSEINQYDTTTTTTTSIDHQVHSSHDHFPYFHPPIHTHTTHQFHLFHHPLQPLQDLNQDLEKQQEDDSSSIKQQQQLFWRPLDLDFFHHRESNDNNNSNNKEKHNSNYKLFSELEAICKPNCDHMANTLTDENDEEIAKKKKKQQRRKRKKRSIVFFFESLVKKLTDHQEELHQKFLEEMESKEKERARREEAWMREEAEKASREAAARAEERALASAREAAIVSFLEKITGESVKLPGDHEIVHMHSNRWPRAEVQALIGVRSNLEVKFREPGLKGPVWEEVSSMMAAMGFNRSAKRCKEKWENINKYFRKAKESGKQRPVNSKTCPYFHQLDELYSKSSSIMSSKDKSELLDDIVLSNENLRFKSSRHGEYEEEDEEEDDDEEKCES